jgi:hypothetical protein
MTRCRMLLIASLPLAGAVVLGVLALLPALRGATKANFERLEKGMSKDAVEEIMGECLSEDLPNCTLMWVDGEPLVFRYWSHPDGDAMAGFLAGRLFDKHWTDSPGWWERLRRWGGFR